MRRWWPDVELDVRNFGWREWLGLGISAVMVLFLVRVWSRGDVGIIFTGVGNVVVGIVSFIGANQQRRGVEATGPKQITVKTLRLILAGGFLATAALLALLIGVASR